MVSVQRGRRGAKWSGAVLLPCRAGSSFMAGKQLSQGQHLPWDTLQRTSLCTPLAGGRASQAACFGSRDGHARPGHGPLPYPSLLPSWRRASPTVTRPSCATCLLRQMRWEKDGGEQAECRGGGARQPRPVWALAPKHPWGCMAPWGAPGPVGKGENSRGPEASSCASMCSSPGFFHVCDVWMKHFTCPVPLSSKVPSQ